MTDITDVITHLTDNWTGTKPEILDGSKIINRSKKDLPKPANYVEIFHLNTNYQDAVLNGKSRNEYHTLYLNVSSSVTSTKRDEYVVQVLTLLGNLDSMISGYKYQEILKTIELNNSERWITRVIIKLTNYLRGK